MTVPQSLITYLRLIITGDSLEMKSTANTTFHPDTQLSSINHSSSSSLLSASSTRPSSVQDSDAPPHSNLHHLEQSTHPITHQFSSSPLSSLSSNPNQVYSSHQSNSQSFTERRPLSDRSSSLSVYSSSHRLGTSEHDEMDTIQIGSETEFDQFINSPFTLQNPHPRVQEVILFSGTPSDVLPLG